MKRNPTPQHQANPAQAQAHADIPTTRFSTTASTRFAAGGEATTSCIAAGKVACIAAWIQRRPSGLTIEQLRFQPDRIALWRDLQIQAPWTPLHRLKGGNAQAFHYWYQAQRILNGGR